MSLYIWYLMSWHPRRHCSPVERPNHKFISLHHLHTMIVGTVDYANWEKTNWPTCHFHQQSWGSAPLPFDYENGLLLPTASQWFLRNGCKREFRVCGNKEDHKLTVEVDCVDAEVEFPAVLCTGMGTLASPICKRNCGLRYANMQETGPKAQNPPVFQQWSCIML